MKKNFLFEFAGAVRAAQRLDVDLALAEGAFLGGGSCRGSRLLGESLCLVHGLDEQEQDKRHQQEVDDGGNEVAVCQNSGIFAFAEFDDPVCEVDPAGQCAEERHQNVIDEGIDDALEGTAYDNADCQVHYIAFGDERFELGNEFFQNSILPFFLIPG